jgi:acid phosphatase class B
VQTIAEEGIDKDKIARQLKDFRETKGNSVFFVDERLKVMTHSYGSDRAKGQTTILISQPVQFKPGKNQILESEKDNKENRK